LPGRSLGCIVMVSRGGQWEGKEAKDGGDEQSRGLIAKCGFHVLCDALDFLTQCMVLKGVVGFLEIELALQSDEQIPGNAEAILKTQGDHGANALFLANYVTQLGFADIHGGGGGDLRDTVMFKCVPDEGGGRVGEWLGNLERIPWYGGRLRFHWR
jgi:hypothetical protein